MTSVRRRVLGTAVVAGLLSACTGAPDTGPDEITPVVDAEPGELVTLFTTADVDEDIHLFGVSDVAPLPDGTVAVSYDLAAESGGDETPRQQRLAILGGGGALAPVDLPDLDGVEVGADASLLTAAPDGTIYLWDREPNRVVALGPDGAWRVLPVELVLQWRYAPLAAVGADGSLYLCDDDAVQRLDVDGTLSKVVGVYTPGAGEGQPPVPRDKLPLPASSLRLPYPFGLAVGADRTVYVSNGEEVLAVDSTGLVSLVQGFAPPDLGSAASDGEPGTLGIDADGGLLVSYFTEQLVVKVAESGGTVLVRDAILAGSGLNAAYSPGGDVLVLILDPDSHLAGEDDPPRLGAFGR